MLMLKMLQAEYMLSHSCMQISSAATQGWNLQLCKHNTPLCLLTGVGSSSSLLLLSESRVMLTDIMPAVCAVILGLKPARHDTRPTHHEWLHILSIGT